MQPDSPTPGSQGKAPVEPRIAGLRKGKPSPTDPNSESSPQGLIQSAPDESSYNRRNEVVIRIRDMYGRYGESVAMAVLTKALTPKGLSLILERLQLQSTGDDIRDHEQIIAYIGRSGLEEFCQTIGVRFDPEKTRREMKEVEVKRLKNEADRERQRIMANRAKRRDSTGGASPRVNMNDMGLKPVSLNKPPDPEERRLD